VPALIETLGDKDVRRVACEALGEIGDASAVPVLIEAVGDEYEDVRWTACGALEEIGDASAVPALIKALGDWNKTVRTTAGEALKKIGKPAVPALIKALWDSNWDLRRTACWVLGWIRDASAVPALIEALGDKDIRRVAYEALVQIGEPAVPHLKKAVESAPPDIREHVQRVLERIEQRKR
jgi:HEAT repeat protein